MKKMLPVLLAALVGLAGCSKSSDPAAKTATPTLEATWTFQSESTVTTPKSGGAATTSVRPIAAGAYTVTYATGGVLTTRMGTSTTTGNYTFANNLISIPYSSTNGPKTQLLNVTELTSARLVTVENTEDSANRYATTDTFTR